jgi:ketosteroid isomerase-like protein
VSEWTLTGTSPAGQRVEVHGCDHFEFRNGKIVKKDSYWKIVEPR